MLTTRWQPLGSVWSEMNRVQREMERYFERNGANGPRQLAAATYPALNLWEDNDNLFVEAELPGLELDDLEIYVNGDNQLTIKGERKRPVVDGGTWHRQERGYGTFNRLIELPQEVNPDKVTAEFKSGVLTIALPKREEIKPRRIQVKVN